MSDDTREAVIHAICQVGKLPELEEAIIESGISVSDARRLVINVLAWLDDDDLADGLPLSTLDGPDALGHPSVTPQLREHILARLDKRFRWRRGEGGEP